MEVLFFFYSVTRAQSHFGVVFATPIFSLRDTQVYVVKPSEKVQNYRKTT